MIKALIKSQIVDLVCLQETKIKEMSSKIVRRLGVGRCLKWEVVNLRGATDGALVFGDNRVLWLMEMKVGNFLVLCWFKNYENDFCWSFAGVYGPTLKKENEDF